MPEEQIPAGINIGKLSLNMPEEEKKAPSPHYSPRNQISHMTPNPELGLLGNASLQDPPVSRLQHSPHSNSNSPRNQFSDAIVPHNFDSSAALGGGSTDPEAIKSKISYLDT